MIDIKGNVSVSSCMMVSLYNFRFIDMIHIDCFIPIVLLSMDWTHEFALSIRVLFFFSVAALQKQLAFLSFYCILHISIHEHMRFDIVN